jgi:iron complex outermembrane receptor protein
MPARVPFDLPRAHPMSFRPTPWAALIAAGLALPATAQTTASASTAESTIVVTGNPLGRDSLAQPTSSLSGDTLLLRRAATLGDTLSSLPGTAASSFGPNSSRPVIRGLDGDRVRLLDNGGAMVDASNLSFDHAVAVDPLVVERIELLRGPAALLYGGNAAGGVVNTLDNRIPRSAAAGLGGRAEVRLGGAAAERSGALVIDGGQGAWAWHADAFGRQTSDLRVPTFVPIEDGQALDASDRVRNSAARAEGGAVGASWVNADGHLGLAVDTYRNRYGVTVEPDVTIRMQRDRLQLGGEQRRLQGWFDLLSFSASNTRYRHEEVEGSGDVGTTFASRGQELRLQARHVALGPWRGVVGLQAERLRFSALGEEAFVPGTLTRSQAVFVLEEADFGPWRVQAGLRSERVRVASDGDVDADTPRFGAATQRRFSPASASLGATWRLAEGWALGTTAGHTERAPAYYELYANGVHVATAAYERGDASLGLERSRNLGATLEWRQGPHSVKASVYNTRFSRFISLAASGNEIDTGDGGSVPEYRFEPVRALFRGFELEGRWRVIERPWKLDLSALVDAVRATDLDRDAPLPRIAPMRLHLGADLATGPWTLGLGVRHAARQGRVADGDRPTPSSTLWNAWASWRLPLAGVNATAFVRLDNLTDQLAYNATAVPTIRDLTPLGGRALMAGIRVQL